VDRRAIAEDGIHIAHLVAVVPGRRIVCHW
jgi:hypothetical protein